MTKWQYDIKTRVMDAFDFVDVKVGDIDSLGNYIIEVSQDYCKYRAVVIEEKAPFREIKARIQDALFTDNWDGGVYKLNSSFFE